MGTRVPPSFSEDQGASFIRFWELLCDFVTSNPEVSAVEYDSPAGGGAEIEFLYEGVPFTVTLK